MKVLSAAQLKEWDHYTILNKPINAIQLMEHAATVCYNKINEIWTHNADKWNRIDVFCGTGNNGGDGLAIARLLFNNHIPVRVFVVKTSSKTSSAFDTSLTRLKSETNVQPVYLSTNQPLPDLTNDVLVVDALLGIGLNYPIEGFVAIVVKQINQSKANVISIDVPSGLPVDIDNLSWVNEGAVVHAWCTLTFQATKATFLIADTFVYVGNFEILPIGLMPIYLQSITTTFYYTTHHDAVQLLEKRIKFSHKGIYGHALLVAGSFGKIGAAILASKAALRAGCGLLTAYLPKVGYTIMQTSLPEAMVQTDDELYEIRNFPNTNLYQAVGVGPGIGTHLLTQKAFINWIQSIENPVVIDADGLNMIAAHLNAGNAFRFPQKCIITPHPKEFDRLVGFCTSAAHRLKQQILFAQKHKVVVVLKGAHTSIALPNGEVYFNSSGNSMLATAGSGDVLLGVILSFLAQGYSLKRAAILGVFVHGLCADNIKSYDKATIIASDIVEELPYAINTLV